MSRIIEGRGTGLLLPGNQGVLVSRRAACRCFCTKASPGAEETAVVEAVPHENTVD